MTTTDNIVFGLMHPKTGKLARELRAYDDQRGIRIYHNEDNNALDTDDTYDDELEGNDEEDNHAVFDWYDLGCILDIIASIVPPDDDYDEFRFSTEERPGKTWPNSKATSPDSSRSPSSARRRKSLASATPTSRARKSCL